MEPTGYYVSFQELKRRATFRVLRILSVMKRPKNLQDTTYPFGDKTFISRTARQPALFSMFCVARARGVKVRSVSCNIGPAEHVLRYREIWPSLGCRRLASCATTVTCRVIIQDIARASGPICCCCCCCCCCLPLFNFSQVYRHCCLLAVARDHSSHRNGEGRIA